MKFKVGNKVITEDGICTCVCADLSTAVFGQTNVCIDKDEEVIESTSYEDLFAVSNLDDDDDGFNFKRISGIKQATL
ncbi:hypothetical protein ACKGJO_06680 [Gracilimonas sp. Q87]|uniref:hypothetical protein n=1 Tax=Gracilimonas sp. Q87 TaxID=3384766 RepID=UPI00398448C8